MSEQLNNNTSNLENILNDIDNIADPVSGTLSITTNGTHDVSTYASANVNVQSAPVLVWQNASPSSNVGTTDFTYTFNGEWDAYFVETIYGAIFSDSNNHISFVTDTTGTNMVVHAFRDGSLAESRKVKAITKNSITFDSYYGFGMICIPVRIWGVKFTL